MYVVQVKVYYDWEATYVIPKSSEQEAKEVAFNAAKNKSFYALPSTLEEFEQDDCYSMRVLSNDAELMM